MSKYEEELLEGLTDEERAALEEDEQEAVQNNAEGDADEDQDKSGEESEGSDGDGEDDAEEGADAGEGDGDGSDDGDDAGSDDDPEGKSKAKQPTDPAVPLLVADAPEDAESRLKELSDQKVELADKFDNGDITAKEYQTQLDALNKEERAIERAVEKAKLAAEMRQQQEVNVWLSQVREFTTVHHPEYSQSRTRWIALDTFVKEIGSKPENASLSGPEILRMAHEQVVADLGEAPGQSQAKGSRPLKGSKAQPPKTLAKVPAADNTGIEDSRWAALDRLRETDPLAHEEKLMKLSEAERDEYLSRA